MTTLALLQTAVNHHQANQLEQAEGLYRQILTSDPNHADALHLLGVIAHQRGQHQAAVELIERAIQLNPDVPAYHSNLATTYRALGNLAKAAEHGRIAASLQPDNADVHLNLGLVLQQLGELDEAISHFETAIELKPHWSTPYQALGNLLYERGKHFEALAVFREGIRLCGDVPQLYDSTGQLLYLLGQADNALVYFQELVRIRPDGAAFASLGNALASLGRREEAKIACRRAIQLTPNLALPFGRLGRLLREEGKYDEALACIQQALVLEPDSAELYCDLAGVYYDLDRSEESVAAFRQGLTRQPQNAEAHNFLGYVLQDRGEMEEALEEYRTSLRIRPEYADGYLNLALLLSEMGEIDQAREAFGAALRLNPEHPEALGGLALTLRARFPQEHLAACERLLASGRLPGQRQAVLQYGVAAVMEARGDFARAADLVRRANGYFKEQARLKGSEYNPLEHQAYVDSIIRTYSPALFERVRGWGVESELPVFVLGLPRSGTSLVEQILASHPQVYGAGELLDIRNIYRSLPATVGKQATGIECIGDLTRAHVQTLANRYLDRIRGLAPGALRIVDKMPDNYLMLGLIATLLPRARIIHLRRDIRDAGLSCWTTHFKHIRWACDLEHIGRRIRDYQRLMEHFRKVLPIPIFEIDYEEIVANLEPSARRLVDWCELEWDPACLAFHETKRVVRTASMTQVREPIYKRSVERWRNFEDVLAPMLEALEAK
jgi:tetratricopeptide (TPR) repeat protein